MIFDGWHIMRGDGDGITIYFGRDKGSPFIGFGLLGFHGWRSYPQWMPGGWAFFNPHLHLGRLCQSNGRWWSGRLLLPAKLVDWWRS